MDAKIHTKVDVATLRNKIYAMHATIDKLGRIKMKRIEDLRERRKTIHGEALEALNPKPKRPITPPLIAAPTSTPLPKFFKKKGERELHQPTPKQFFATLPRSFIMAEPLTPRRQARKDAVEAARKRLVSYSAARGF